MSVLPSKSIKSPCIRFSCSSNPHALLVRSAPQKIIPTIHKSKFDFRWGWSLWLFPIHEWGTQVTYSHHPHLLTQCVSLICIWGMGIVVTFLPHPWTRSARSSNHIFQLSPFRFTPHLDSLKHYFWLGIETFILTVLVGMGIKLLLTPNHKSSPPIPPWYVSYRWEWRQSSPHLWMGNSHRPHP